MVSTNKLDHTLNLGNFNIWNTPRKAMKGRKRGERSLTRKLLQVKQIHANSIEMVELISV